MIGNTWYRKVDQSEDMTRIFRLFDKTGDRKITAILKFLVKLKLPYFVHLSSK